MKRRLLDVFQPADTPEAELDRLLGRLRVKRQQHQMQDEMLVTPDELERQLDELNTQFFEGALAPDEFDRQRAALTKHAADGRRIRDELAKIVEAGETRCLELVDQIHEGREAERQERIEAAQAERAEALTRVLGAEARLAKLADEARDLEVAYGEMRGSVSAKLRRDFDAEDRELIRRWNQAVRHQAAGADPLPARLRERAERQLRGQGGAATAADIDALLAAKTVDPDGEIVPAYTRLDPNGGYTRLP